MRMAAWLRTLCPCCCRPTSQNDWYDKDVYSATSSVPRFSVSGRRLARVVDVYDGDTVTAAMRIDGTIQKTRVRLSGLDAPEMRSSSDEEVRSATRCRDHLRAMVDGKVVWLFCESGADKYGRVLAVLVCRRNTLSLSARRMGRGDGDPVDTIDPTPGDAAPESLEECLGPFWVNANEEMLRLPAVVPYHGGKKA